MNKSSPSSGWRRLDMAASADKTRFTPGSWEQDVSVRQEKRYKQLYEDGLNGRLGQRQQLHKRVLEMLRGAVDQNGLKLKDKHVLHEYIKFFAGWDGLQEAIRRAHLKKQTATWPAPSSSQPAIVLPRRAATMPIQERIETSKILTQVWRVNAASTAGRKWLARANKAKFDEAPESADLDL